jgi:hypothetical protein
LIIPRTEPVRIEAPRRLRRFGFLELPLGFGSAVDDPVFGRVLGRLPSGGCLSGGAEVDRRAHSVPRIGGSPKPHYDGATSSAGSGSIGTLTYF